MKKLHQILPPARIAAAVGAGLLLAACAGTDPSDVPAAWTTQEQDVYRLREGDVVSLAVFQEPYMDTRQRILSDGTISVGMIGRVPVAGDTLPEAARHIEDLLARDHLVNPQVTLTIDSYAPRRFVVWGQVKDPGSFVIPDEERVSLPEAIAMAGGNTEIGNPRRVRVTRRSPEGEQRITVNAMSPDAHDFYVKEGDILHVAETVF